MKRGRAGISVMFMTFIAVSILSTIFLTYYLYLTQQNLSASEAQRIYAEASQERLEAFFYPPAKEASDIGISQRLKIYNRGIGTIIRYIFAPMVQEEPLNSEDIVLRSGASVTLQLDQAVPDEENIRVITDRGSVFIAQLGYFNISFDPAKLILNPGEEGVSTLRIVSKNYEAEMVMEVVSSDISEENYEIIGETEFNLTKNGIHTIIINVTAPEIPGTYQISVKVEELGTGYYRETTLEMEVVETVGTSIPFSYLVIEIQDRQVSGSPGDSITVRFKVKGYNGYHGTVRFDIYDPDNVINGRSVQFTPSSVTITPDYSEADVILSFRIRDRASSGEYRIWVEAYEEWLFFPLYLRDSEYFDLEIS